MENLREQFAGIALQAYLSNPYLLKALHEKAVKEELSLDEELAMNIVETVDALINELNKPKKEDEKYVRPAIGEKEVPMATMESGHEKMKVVTLCGSTRFKEQFLETQKRLTLEGDIVISVGLFGHSGDEEVWEPGTKEMLDKMHLQKIDMADEIFVLNVGGYIGESTRREIAHAEKTGKKIVYLEK